jgi:hypothetical protein
MNKGLIEEKKLKIVPIIVFLLILIIVLSPILLWISEGPKELNVLVLDNTVPDNKYREHKGLFWILNNEKYVFNGKNYNKKVDYYGFFPLENKKYEIKKVPSNLDNVDIVYIADSYGVYEREFYGENIEGARSKLIYGGMYEDDLAAIESYLKGGVTLIAEFNTFGSPTKQDTKSRLYDLLKVEWSGWIGRYFYDLSEGVEVPIWAINNWEAQNRKDWNFSGPGFVFADENDHIVVLEQNKDITSKGCIMGYTDEGKKYFDINEDIRYNYWFDIVMPKDDAIIYSSFILDLTNTGKQKLEEMRIPLSFPAVIYSNSQDYKSYYFAGDFVDIDTVPYMYWIKWYDTYNKWTSSNQDEFENKGFFWHGYVPMMKKILTDAYKNKIS